MGRLRINDETTISRFAAGPFRRIDKALRPIEGRGPEKRSEFIREAVERELKRRERKT